MAQKKDDGKENIRKKLAANGGSQPAKIQVIRVLQDYNSKIKYLNTLIAERFVTNPKFYIQKFEFNAINELIGRDCVWSVNAPNFEYDGIKYATQEFNIMERHKEMMRINKIFIFHTIRRIANGDLCIVGVYI